MTASLGDKLRRHRQEKGYSLDRLAEITESSKSYLWELENRDTRRPSAEKLTRIAQALDVTTDYLLDESATPNEEVMKEAFFRKFSKHSEGDKAAGLNIAEQPGYTLDAAPIAAAQFEGTHSHRLAVADALEQRVQSFAGAVLLFR